MHKICSRWRGNFLWSGSWLKPMPPIWRPVPYRGKQNQPAYVRHVAEKIAELQEVDLEEVIFTTTRNFENLFSVALMSG